MTSQYKRELLKVAVAQICQTIGYNATQASSLELLQDLLQRFILEFSKNLRHQVELCNRTSPTLNDVALTLFSLDINLNELLDYVGNVEPVAFAVDVPKFPVSKPTNLNFLKPGSKEVLTRPVHVFEHLPPMLPPEENQALTANEKTFQKVIKSDDLGFRIKNESDSSAAMPLPTNILATLAPPSKIHDERATREISSVVMTTGGFISPAIEGKLPEAGLPLIIEKFLGLDAPPATPPPSIVDTPPLPPIQKSPEPVDVKTNLSTTEAKETPKLSTVVTGQNQSFIKKNSKSCFKNDPQALKNLKKIKKKIASNVNSSVNKNMSTLSLEEVLKMNVETLSEKARRKRFKILQKLLKNSQKQEELEKVKELPLPAYVAELAIGPERLLLEKLLKKQAKEKQKISKKQKQNQSQLSKHAIDSPQSLEVHKQTMIETIKTEKLLEPLAAQPLTNEIKQMPISVEPTFTTALPLELPSVVEAAESAENLSIKSELKLTNEPDRSKLNIFKKISKAQKVPQLSNQTQPVNTSLHVGVFTGSEGEIINLPTGTTITPAPPIFNTPMGLESESFLAATAAPSVMETLPKKRGRKPGSKNQPKPQMLKSDTFGINNTGIGKKPKKIKPPKNVNNFGPLSIDTQFKAGVLERSPNKNFTPPMTSPITNLALQTSLKPISRKERKEKTEKFKFSPEPLPGTHPFSVPLPEQAAINVKTESFGVGSVHVKPIDLLLNDPEQESVLKAKNKKRSINQQNPSQKKIPQLPTNLLSTFPPPGFPTLAPNMLPLFPFPFPPTPGLIPAQGLFAPSTPGLPAYPVHHTSGLSASSAANVNVTNQTLMGLGTPFFPFAPSNSTPNQTGKDRARDFSMTASNESRNYCNVAPLVPPNLKLTGTNASSDISQKHRDDSVANLISPTNLSRKSLIEEAATTKQIQTGNIGDPIEVSDDSDDTSKPFDIKPFIKASDSVVKPATKTDFPSPPLSTLPIASTSSIPNPSKKQKKSQKGSSTPQTNFELDVFPIGGEIASRPAFDSGFGKLAGGADLIPLSNLTPGSAYSAKSIPATSLTATARQITPTSLVHPPMFEGNKETEQKVAGALFNDVTITPTTAALSLKSSLKKKNKEHKKLRKLKEDVDGKIKKKKDKKEKFKEKERLGLLASDNGQEKISDQRKDNSKKLKKEKKKEKQRFSKDLIKANADGNLESNTHPEHTLDAASNFFTPLIDIVPSSTPAISNVSSSPSAIPKLTLKLGATSQSPIPTTINKMSEEEQIKSNRKILHENEPEREPSPELARFSPLVTRPPKQKLLSQNEVLSTDVPIDFNKTGDYLCTSRPQQPQQEQQKSLLPPPSPWLSGGTLTASSVLLPQQLMTPSSSLPIPPTISKTKSEHLIQPSKNVEENNAPPSTSDVTNNSVSLITENNRPASYVDAEGNTVWICPACGKVDDGSPMIGCDGCDAWYHWECVGIAVAPSDNEDWFCRVCITRKKGFYGNNEGIDKKRKRNKKK